MTGKKNKPRTVTKYPNAKPGSLEDNTKTVVEKSQPYLRPIAPKPTYVNAPPLDLTTQSVLPDKNDQLAAQETAVKPIKKKKNEHSVNTSSSEEEMDVDEEKSAGTESSIETHPQELPLSGNAIASTSGTTDISTTASLQNDPTTAAIITHREGQKLISYAQHGEFPEGKSLEQSQHARKPVTVTHGDPQHQSASTSDSEKGKSKEDDPSIPVTPITRLDRQINYRVTTPETSFKDKSLTEIRHIVERMFAAAPSFSYVYIEKATKARPNPMVYAIFKKKANAETAATIVIPGSNDVRMSLMDTAAPEANNEEKERTIKVTEIPLNFDSETVKTVLNKTTVLSNVLL